MSVSCQHPFFRYDMPVKQGIISLFLMYLQIFLKELPGGLLVFEHYESWTSALEKERTEDAQRELRR